MATTLALSLAFAIWLSACGFGSASPAAPRPDQLLKTTFRNLEKSSSYRVQGTFTGVIPRVDVDVIAVHPLGARGSITDDSRAAKLSFVYRDGKTYFSGTSVPGTPGKLGTFLAGKWVFNSTADTQIEPLISTRKLASPVLLEVAFLVGQAGFKSRSVTYAGKKAVTLFNAAEKVTVTAGANPQLLKIERPVGAVPQDGFTEVNLEFGEFSRVSTLEVPGSPLDLADPTVLPARYAAVKDTLAKLSCDAASCGAKVTVTNSAGQIEPTPGAMVTIRFTKPDGSLIDACTGPIPLIGHAATEDVACRVNGGAWQRAMGGGGDYQISVTVSNPLYD
ncbi:MAG: hypothetical protein M3Z98_01245 [Candidatus Dormibacteraeota bacterium]|nr:hypothetical protein [Candidatus Dormibacteraeota bacterium]